MAVNPIIKQKADDIRSKIFGSEVRESFASGIEAISEDVEATIGRQSYVEEQFQNVIDETTDKDVISAPELIAARNGEANLKTRLDKEHQEVTAQLQQKANQSFVDSQFASIVGGAPKGTYTDLPALMSAHPNGAEGIFLVLGNGHWYYWNSTSGSWEDGGVYLANSIEDYMVSENEPWEVA
ncbi:hypothetical protein KQ224_04870 [Streptococcus parasuis]|uniref:hypothetical protein n=1 Tax=Streptococcus parasuis TaxID=1501662 RepID=UPI001C1F7DD6|nr:hypothetical protein [Streptococcus parasuis]QWV87411.1 hypothetical protein KQ224_04870 [Streptococcus parasuis]